MMIWRHVQMNEALGHEVLTLVLHDKYLPLRSFTGRLRSARFREANNFMFCPWLTLYMFLFVKVKCSRSSKFNHSNSISDVWRLMKVTPSGRSPNCWTWPTNRYFEKPVHPKCEIWTWTTMEKIFVIYCISYKSKDDFFPGTLKPNGFQSTIKATL